MAGTCHVPFFVVFFDCVLVRTAKICYIKISRTGGDGVDWQKLKTAGKPILLYGMGDGGDRIFSQLASRGIPVSGVFASDEFIRGQTFHSFPVLTYAQAKAQFGSMIVLLAFGTRDSAILARIDAIAGEQTLYCPDFPVVDGPLFTPDFYAENHTRFNAVRAALCDAQSRAVFDGTVEYKLTGDIRPLRACESCPDEAYQNILRLAPGETLVDLGAYRGDTIADFVRFCPDYDRIYAFEPDGYTFRRLVKNTESLKNCTCLNLAASDSDAPLLFSQRGGRNSRAGSGRPVAADSVDHVLAGGRATFLNIDVEGYERSAIAGAVKTIVAWKPKLLVAAYHRSEDFFAIYEQIMAIRPDYRVYLRHFPQLPAWETNLYFV